MILIGIDDTDVLGSRGTNQLAKAIVRALAEEYVCLRIVRHQLLDDPRIPYTSKNGSASITVLPRQAANPSGIVETCRRVMREWFVAGSDPGLCVDLHGAANAAAAFGSRCQHEIVSQHDARSLAAAMSVHLEGLGGTQGGVIGALAAVGLAATGNDGRIVQLGEWPDDLTGLQPLAVLRARGVDVRRIETVAPIDDGVVDLGKHLRPNVRSGRSVLFVKRSFAEQRADCWQAVRLP